MDFDKQARKIDRGILFVYIILSIIFIVGVIYK
jgi:hypothetical protein